MALNWLFPHPTLPPADGAAAAEGGVEVAVAEPAAPEYVEPPRVAVLKRPALGRRVLTVRAFSGGRERIAD